MIEVTGVGVFSGVAAGPLRFMAGAREAVRRVEVADSAAELARFANARSDAGAALDELHEKALKSVGEEEAAIFDVHHMMLDDPDFVESVEGIISSEHVCAEYAVSETAKNFAAMFEAMDDEYMRARAADVRDIASRLIANMTGHAAGISFDEPVILAAKDLAPSETIQLDKSKILAFITQEGSATSHTAILARTMGIPAIVGAGDTLSREYDGRRAILDGAAGKLYIDPDAATAAALEKKRAAHERESAALDALKGKPSVTLDGHKVTVCANLSNISELDIVLRSDAEGIGLFRSEFIYLGCDTFPTEDEQFEIYKRAAEAMVPRQVIIRTLDIGADKQAAYFGLPHEENPAMGMRAIRICLTRPEIFKTQLRAICRAAAFGNIAIMFPMIISPREVEEALAILEQAKQSLRADGVEFKDNISVGIMVETPAAVMMSTELAQMVDFFSVGTNDLTQYTLAADRQNRDVERFCDRRSEAVLRMIKIASENAHAAGKWIGICGEMGADTELTERFLRMGIDEFSVSAGSVLKVRAKVRTVDLSS